MSEIETELDGDASWAAGGSGEARIGEASCDPADGGDAPGQGQCQAQGLGLGSGLGLGLGLGVGVGLGVGLG